MKRSLLAAAVIVATVSTIPAHAWIHEGYGYRGAWVGAPCCYYRPYYWYHYQPFFGYYRPYFWYSRPYYGYYYRPFGYYNYRPYYYRPWGYHYRGW